MRRTGVLVGLAGLLVTGLWWMFLISPRNAQISELEREQDVAIENQSRLQAQIVQLEEIRDSEVQYLAALGTLERLIPERPMLEDFIEQVYALTSDTGVELLTLGPSLPTASADGSDLREIAVSVQVEGQFFEVLGFMFGLSDMDRLVRIDSISATSSQDEFGNTVLSTSLDVRLFTIADLLPVMEDVTAAPDPDTTDPTDGAEAADAPTADGGGE